MAIGTQPMAAARANGSQAATEAILCGGMVVAGIGTFYGSLVCDGLLNQKEGGGGRGRFAPLETVRGRLKVQLTPLEARTLFDTRFIQK